ncbi:MAG: MotA/TolQ/ExbB proton channel family protein [Nitrospinae bacterium]|nr:MotA/TolQ/ExbB proton channel family protein [Nitrospinota bacterium]
MQTIGLGGDVFDLVVRAGPVGKLVLLILVGFSVVSWAIILHKWWHMRRIRRETRMFHEVFAESDNLALVYAATKQYRVSPLARIFAAGYAELRPYLTTKAPVRGRHGVSDDLNGDLLSSPDPLQMGRFRRVLGQVASEQALHLERLLSFLATTGSTTPFIGLFGTVWGVMNAFHGIGQRGSATLATVAPGISEALIATAAGLAAAIPAVMAYNHFVSHIRVMSIEMENFSNEFASYAERELLKRT